MQLNGADVTGDPMYMRARKGISYLPQEPSVFRKLTVEENILAILETLPLTREERSERLAELLEELSIAHLAKNKAYSLSGRRAAARRDHPRPGDRAAASCCSTSLLQESIHLLFSTSRALWRN